MSISLNWHREIWYLKRLYLDYQRGEIMAGPADLQKLVENMKRAQSIVGRAATDAAKHSAIMDSFEKRLDLNGENMAKIEEYDKLMASMDQMGNGGPALDATFPSSLPVDHPTTVEHSSKGVGRFDQ